MIAAAHGPASLRELGMAEADAPRAAQLTASASHPNPREVTADGIEALLSDAWHGRRPVVKPASHPTPPVAAAESGRLTEQVVASFADAPNSRVGHLLSDLVRHLHRFLTNNDVTDSEWQYAIDFLTRVGQTCTDNRQEFILLSDVLGVSSIVDLLTNSRTPLTTPCAVLGPFYRDDAPEVPHGSDIAAGMAGTPLWVDIGITDTTGAPVPNAVLDVWQSNQDGYYDIQLPGLTGAALRARLRSDQRGRLAFWSILPSEYPIPDDGPVGQMLAAVGRHPNRAPHLHFMISAPGYRQLVTQLFVAGGRYLGNDSVFGVKDELITDFTPQDGPAPDGRVLEGQWRRLDFTFRISPSAG